MYLYVYSNIFYQSFWIWNLRMSSGKLFRRSSWCLNQVVIQFSILRNMIIYSATHWSNCSLAYLDKMYRTGADYCLWNKPEKTIGKYSRLRIKIVIFNHWLIILYVYAHRLLITQDRVTWISDYIYLLLKCINEACSSFEVTLLVSTSLMLCII